MRILFDYHFPFAFAHGGAATQILATKAALDRLGLEVEFLRWWDGSQRGDVVHFFGRPADGYVDFAHRQGMKVVVSDLLGSLGARGAGARVAQRAVMAAARAALPSGMLDRFGWKAYRQADACTALTTWEARLMSEMFGRPLPAIRVVPNGVDAMFFEPSPSERGRFLVIAATIRPLKRVVETCRAAVAAGTPVCVLGKPYSESDPYFQSFRALVHEYAELLRYEGEIEDRRRLMEWYRQARGFVLLSEYESLSLAALEAAACGCPLLLSDLPWARAQFGDDATYAPVGGSSESLRRFYEAAPTLKAPARPLSWDQVAERLRDLYAEVARRAS
jgi:glycosyltransferase involved in cell wall biosynthesis